VDRALPVEEALRPAEAEDALVPDVRVDVQTATAVEPEADETVGRDVVARQGQRHVEGARVQREERRPAVRVVVGVPQQHAPGRTGVVGARQLREDGVGQDVVSNDASLRPYRMSPRHSLTNTPSVVPP